MRRNSRIVGAIGDKRVNVAQFKLDRRMGTLDLIILADAKNKTNRFSATLSIDGQRHRTKPKIFDM